MSVAGPSSRSFGAFSSRWRSRFHEVRIEANSRSARGRCILSMLGLQRSRIGLRSENTPLRATSRPFVRAMVRQHAAERPYCRSAVGRCWLKFPNWRVRGLSVRPSPLESTGYSVLVARKRDETASRSFRRPISYDLCP